MEVVAYWQARLIGEFLSGLPVVTCEDIDRACDSSGLPVVTCEDIDRAGDSSGLPVVTCDERGHRQGM